MTTPTPTPSHTSGAKNPGVTATSQKIWGYVASGFTIIIMIFLIWGIRGCTADRKKEAEVAKFEASERARTNPPPASAAQPAEALVIRYEGITPCSTVINYRFKIFWGDYPLRIIYPGNQIVDRKGKGHGEDFKAPENMQSGEAKFISLDPLQPNFRVQVYEVITVRK